MDSSLSIIFTILGVAIVIGVLFGFVLYVIGAIAFYKIAKNRGYNKPWLAWIPIANDYLKGAIADDINYRGGKTTSLRLWLLIASIVTRLGSLIYAGVQLASTVSMLADTYGAFTGAGGYDGLFSQTSNATIMLSLVSLLISALSIGYAVLYYIAMYRIYTDYVPRNAVLFLVLSIVFGVTEPFFVMSMRNKPAISIYGAQNPQWQPAAPPVQQGYTAPVYHNGQGNPVPPVVNPAPQENTQIPPAPEQNENNPE